MKYKKFVSILLVCIIVLGGWYFYKHQTAAPQTKNVEQSGQIQPPEQKQNDSLPLSEPGSQSLSQNAPAPGADHFSTENDIQPPPPGEPKRVEVDYDGMQFDPSSVTIAVGDTVVFRNKSQGDFWPASNPHPTHSDYPGFDARKNIGPGQTYEFTFNKVGRWSFHNHLSPSIGGIIIVEK